jgi:hypothetical protein
LAGSTDDVFHRRPFAGGRLDGSPGFNDSPRKKKCMPAAITEKPSTTPIQ